MHTRSSREKKNRVRGQHRAWWKVTTRNKRYNRNTNICGVIWHVIEIWVSQTVESTNYSRWWRGKETTKLEPSEKYKRQQERNKTGKIRITSHAHTQIVLARLVNARINAVATDHHPIIRVGNSNRRWGLTISNRGIDEAKRKRADTCNMHKVQIYTVARTSNTL